ncbi:hypothetical protein [Streptomyces longwoodensis]
MTLATCPSTVYSVVLVGSWAELEPPLVIAATGAVWQTMSAHSGRPLQAPVPVAEVIDSVAMHVFALAVGLSAAGVS